MPWIALPRWGEGWPTAAIWKPPSGGLLAGCLLVAAALTGRRLNVTQRPPHLVCQTRAILVARAGTCAGVATRTAVCAVSPARKAGDGVRPGLGRAVLPGSKWADLAANGLLLPRPQPSSCVTNPNDPDRFAWSRRWLGLR